MKKAADCGVKAALCRRVFSGPPSPHPRRDSASVRGKWSQRNGFLAATTPSIVLKTGSWRGVGGADP